MKHIGYLFVVLFLGYSCASGEQRKEDRQPAVKPVIPTDSVAKITRMVCETDTGIKADTSDLERRFVAIGLVNVKVLDTSICVELKYGTNDNFMERDMYGGLRNAYLPCDVAIKLSNAQYYLKQINPSYRLLLFDAARPLSVQCLIWDSVKLRTYEKYLYISPPDQVSLHNYGAAVDVSVYDTEKGMVLDMGTPFDFFGKLAQPRYELFYLEKGDLTPEQIRNRRILRQCMCRSGFFPITTEWWHFNATNKWLAARRYVLIE
ncbi:MAG: M15 family metallopeptidase [Sediminibacterium sp.]|nr:M15 family metallopeptidase [Sediminibacterium sp.]